MSIDLNQKELERFREFVSQCPNIRIWVFDRSIDYVRMTKDAGAGVYFQLRRDGALYVGETINLSDRTRRHFLCGVRLRALAFIPMPFMPDSERLKIETEMIHLGIDSGFRMDNSSKMLPQEDPDPLLELASSSKPIIRTGRQYETWIRTLHSPESRYDGMRRYRAHWNAELEQLWNLRTDAELRLVDRFVEAIPGQWKTFEDSWKFELTEKRLEIWMEGELAFELESGIARIRMNEIVLITAFGHEDEIRFPGIEFKAIDLYWMWAKGDVYCMHRLLEEDWAAMAVYRFL